MSTHIVCLSIALIVVLLGVVAFYWFDIAYRLNKKPLETITADYVMPSVDAATEKETTTYNSNFVGESHERASIEEDEAIKETAYAYLAGGCFWCVEKDMEKLTGVGDAISGYSGGASADPTYTNHSDHRETVQVPYDPSMISYRELLQYFFRHHDGTDQGGSFYDRGHSYTSAVYYLNEPERVIAEKVKKELDILGIFERPLATTIEPFRTFTVAEEYHQNYYKRDFISAQKYLVYRKASGRDDFIAEVALREANLIKQEQEPAENYKEEARPGHLHTTGSWVEYKKPTDEVLRSELSAIAYKVTQQDGTERAFSQGNLDDEKRAGIFVDVLSGEPLFSSRDKFDSGTGWPSFTKPISEEFITVHKDSKLWYTRTEARSRYADNHLGHVFNDGPQVHRGEPSTGERWCMNGAALRFIPQEEMVKNGYGAYTQYLR